VPGNERSVQKLKDNLSRQGARIIHRDTDGRARLGPRQPRRDLLDPPKDQPALLYADARLPLHAARACRHCQSLRPLEDEIVSPTTAPLSRSKTKAKIVRLKEMAPNGLRLVDGFAIGDIQEVVIRDRTVLAQEGMFVIIATVNPKTGKLRKSPDIISRGFVYLRESPRTSAAGAHHC
jgi:ribonuclease J